MAFITYASFSAFGFAPIGQICKQFNTFKYCYNVAYGSNACGLFNPPEPIECTYTNRIVLTGEVKI